MIQQFGLEKLAHWLRSGVEGRAAARHREQMRAMGSAAAKGMTQRERIFALLSECQQPLLREEIASRLGIRSSSVCARLDELKSAGLVVEGAPRISETSRIVCMTYQAATTSHTQGEK